MVTIISKIQATILIHSGIQLLQFILPNLPGHVNNLIFAKIRYILKYCNYSEPHSQNRCFTACFLLMWLLRHINWVKYACKQAYSALICMALNSYKMITKKTAVVSSSFFRICYEKNWSNLCKNEVLETKVVTALLSQYI